MSKKYQVSEYIHLKGLKAFNPFWSETENFNRIVLKLLYELKKEAKSETEIISSYGRPLFEKLQERKIIRAEHEKQEQLFFLKYVQLDTNRNCNQSCTYCPVSHSPRKQELINEALFDKILKELKPYQTQIEGIILSSYNEPTIDPNFQLWVKKIRDAGFPCLLLSNGSNLTPANTDFLRQQGVDFIVLNLPSVAAAEYYHFKGVRDLDKVLENIRYALTQNMEIHLYVMGNNDTEHQRRTREVQDYFKNYPKAIAIQGTIHSRAGNLPVKTPNHQSLKGCASNGCRLFNWLHINTKGQCFICCQDFEEKYIIGDLNKQSIKEVLSGEKMAQLKKWTYGLEPAPADYICRKCENAVI